MNRVLLIAFLVVAGCGDGNYGALPVVGQKDNCHRIVDAVLERTAECQSRYAYPDRFEAFARACDNALSVGHVDIDPCLAAIQMWPCAHINKLPMECEGLFSAI